MFTDFSDSSRLENTLHKTGSQAQTVSCRVRRRVRRRSTEGRKVETSGPSHSQGHGHEPAGFEDQHGVDQSPEPEDNTTDTSSGAEPRGETARFQTITPVEYRQPVVLNHRRTPNSLPWPAAVAPLVPLLLNLSGDDRNLLLKVIKHQDFSSQLVPWKSADQPHSFLDKNSVNASASAFHANDMLSCRKLHNSYSSS